MRFYAVRAENATLWDANGKEYIDFAGGIAVLNTGHLHPKVKAAISAQLDNFTHTAYQIVPYEGYISLAERINRLAPIDGLKKTASSPPASKPSRTPSRSRARPPAARA